MIHYDKDARLSFARERARLLQNEMRAARHASALNPSTVLRRSFALLARALRIRREGDNRYLRPLGTRRAEAAGGEDGERVPGVTIKPY
jgi:hypothetical protein